MKKPLKWCCNGCKEPPQLPSFVLCKKCFEALCGKMDGLRAELDAAEGRRP